MDELRLPPLPLEEWEATKDTLQLWTQIMGKTRLALMPTRNHWWNATLYAASRPGIGAVDAVAYSHEIISFGFWAVDQNNPFPAHYSYTSPEPTELTQQVLRPPPAEWVAQGNGSLAILPYDDVRSAADPKATLLEFLQSAYEAGASLAGWDLADTATQWCPVPPDRLARLSHAPTRSTDNT